MLPAKDFSPLKMGHTLAPDKKRRVAVSDEHIESVGLRLTGHHRDSFDWMLATGARPSELVNLTMANIDTRGEICVADLVEHNNARPSHHAKRLQFQKILENLIEQHPCRLQ